MIILYLDAKCNRNSKLYKTRRSGTRPAPSACQKTHGELERTEALSIFNRARRRVRRVRGGFCGGKSHFPEQKSLPCSFCARKSERFQQKLVGVCLHSYNDTVNANTGVIIKRCFRGFPPLEGVQILKPYCSICFILLFLCFSFLCPKC